MGPWSPQGLPTEAGAALSPAAEHDLESNLNLSEMP